MVERPVTTAGVEPAPVHERVSATAGGVRGLRAIVRRWLSDLVADLDTIDGLVCGVSEAAENAVEHAFPRAAPGTVTLTAAVAHVTHRCAPFRHVVITVSDDGRWQPAGDPGYRGRGLHLIRGAAPIVSIEAGAAGTVVTLSSPIGPRRGPPRR